MTGINSIAAPVRAFAGESALTSVRPRRVDPNEQALFRTRLRDALDGQSVNGFAKRVPVSQSVMRQYLIGESEPTRPVVLAIARAAGVSPSWLAFGLGPRVGV